MSHIDNYDAILYVMPQINEDERSVTTTTALGRFGQQYVGVDDPKMYDQFSFGRSIQRDLNSMGEGFSAEVNDYGKWVTVDVFHHNVITGRTSKKSFLIVFQRKGDGIVLSTHSKWRTISGASQAVSYIRSAASALKNDTSTKL